MEPWLVVIDPQAIFASPDSPWGSPMWSGALPRIVELVAQHRGRVIITRFSPQLPPEGSWADYYREWPFAKVPDDDPLYAIVPELADAADQIVTRPTFGKWGSDLIEITGPTPELVITGVSTDCCVIATAIPAADAGARVVVDTAGCAGSTPENHENAIEVMKLFPPQLTVV